MKNNKSGSADSEMKLAVVPVSITECLQIITTVSSYNTSKRCWMLVQVDVLGDKFTGKQCHKVIEPIICRDPGKSLEGVTLSNAGHSTRHKVATGNCTKRRIN